ncbi:MAG TPA: PIN domain-containing protein [Tepidisphaeraceae bacterium]|nr:PIN domain-containing protein [Tepidisphaeraceae bacterium]
MIHRDTNVLIRAVSGTPHVTALLNGWLVAGETVRADAIAWAEFHCGPLTAQDAQTARVLVPDVVTVERVDSERAAVLFNQSGRRRGSLADCLIAAVCLRTGASIATANVADFQPFQSDGLTVINV